MQAGSCVEPDCAVKEAHLNASALSDPNSLRPLVTASKYNIPPFPALVDSGSTHCFVDQSFVNIHAISTYSVPPITLRLFDGTTTTIITHTTDLSIHFTSGNITPMTFFVTLLDSDCRIVLGHNWLTRFNPLIDWVLGSIKLRLPPHQMPTPSSPPDSSRLDASSLVPTPPQAPLNDTPDAPGLRAPPIAFINAAAYARVCKLEGSTQFLLQLRQEPDGKLRASSLGDAPDLSAVPEVYHDFADVFSKANASSLPPHRDFDLKIELEDGASPPPGRLYLLSLFELDALRKFIDENLSTGFIRPTLSSHAAPVLFIKKKDGSLRLCVDYRGLNKLTKKDRYPLPLIADLLDSPSCAKVYSKIDLCHVYHLVRIAEGDEWKTAFRMQYGSYEWLVMPFGLTNAPSTFQRFVNTVFADMLDITIIVYLDDILIYSDNLEDHKKHVREVLCRLRKYGLYAKPEKCEFHTDTTEYLGYCLSPTGLTMAQNKVDIIRDWPEPRKVKDIQSFLGFANFYCRFIYNYSDIVVPLTRLTQKDALWNFSTDCRRSFNSLKEAFTSAPILTHYQPDAPIIVETDASDYAIAGILSNICPNGEICPVAFYSHTLTAPKLNYDTHDKELLTIFEAFRSWRHYLEGSASPVDVVTDHKNLIYFSTSKVLTRHQARWSEYLSQFNLVILFHPGKLSAKPDALTRCWDVYPKEGDKGFACVNPQNLCPVFTTKQLNASLRATHLQFPVL